MIYLGKQEGALNYYGIEVLCWLKIKLRGKYSNQNTEGHNCGSSTCKVCTRSFRKKENINPDFVRLLNDRRLEQVIYSEPEQLIQIENIFQQLYVQGDRHTADDFNVECKNLFVTSGYEDFFYKNLNYRLAEWLDIHTCTYCNRQYTFVVRKPNGEKGMVPQFDHWYAKGRHPLFALSFYNLIPSCGICNSSIKSQAIMSTSRYLHPYVDSNISQAFRFSYLAITPNNYEVICKSNDSSNVKIQNTIDLLETKLLYIGHSGKELQDLINLRYKYSDNYLDILLKNTFNGLNISESDKYRLIFGIEIDENNYHKRPFSKFKKDIIEELMKVNYDEK